MPNVAVVTDSCASLPEALIEALNIQWVAYYIHRGEEVLRDLVTIQRDEFLKWMETAKTLPTTASPGPGDYLSMYENLAKQGKREIISLHMTSKGSGAYQAACVAQSMAREVLPDVRIEVVDTRSVSLGQGLMVIEAARAALAGKNLDQLLALVQAMIPITRMIQTADTLKYLYMGGRIGRAQHLVGTLLNIKPLIGMEDGVIVALGKARSRLGAYKMMAEMVERAAGYQGKIKIAYVHAGARQEVEKIRELVEARLTCVETLIAELSPALAVHSGPGTAGLCYYPVEG
ncbi:MAG: DegV family protein [Chloroflexi bacterium]|nr:MAG: DegV family protein [Chloroflexota bacterium]